MNLNKKLFILSIIIISIFLIGAYYAQDFQNTDYPIVAADYNNETDIFGCCSIVLQLENNDTIMSYRRDSNVTADVHIENVQWHGKNVIKQYKTEEGYFCHVIITNDGWVIGLGGIDDGIDNEKCENITADMISDDYSISKESLAKIQKIKKPYGRGHVLIKAPNGNYGFANVDKLKTGKLKPGQYISIPNNYSYSRAGNVSLDTPDKIKAMTELSQSDKYGVDRREIITYDFHSNVTNNTTDIYVSNEDGSKLGINYTDCIDDVYLNKTLIKGKDIPIGPDYKKIGSVSFSNEQSNFIKLYTLIIIVAFVIFVGLLFFAVLKFVRFIKFKIKRQFRR